MIKSFFEDVSQIYLSNQLRLEKLEISIPHTSGSLVKKGKDKLLVYWQYRTDGKQVQVPIEKGKEDKVQNKSDQQFTHKESKKNSVSRERARDNSFKNIY